MARRKRGHYSGIGGQAVIEGVMMKNHDRYAVAVRTPSGEIEVALEEYESFAPAKILTRIPFIRGIFNFIDSLILGTKTLTYSASFYEEVDDKKQKEKPLDKALGDNSGKVLSVFSVILSVILAIGLFMLLPYYLSQYLRRWVISETAIAVFEGLIRVLIFVLYIVAISLMKDIRRVFMYHGAEHKCINCLEKGNALTVENVRNASRLHKRCGTSFLFYVIFISVILFIFIRVDDPILRVLVRILLIPVIAGISYEIIRLAGRSNNILILLLSSPGFLLQRMTTREPDDDMIEVGIASIEAVFDWKEYLWKEFRIDVDAIAPEPEPVYEEPAPAAEPVAEPVYEEAVPAPEPVYEEPVQTAAEPVNEETPQDKQYFLG
ncbi:MAG: DUF1385 domain-containing protein [Lachnospiraceae bacterium]|nr:DUF1385 domain-containing protein [Lachnospiraceae bacterium]